MSGRVLYGIKHSRIDQVKFFEGCLPQILLGPFLNTLFRICFRSRIKESFIRQPLANFDDTLELEKKECLN